MAKVCAEEDEQVKVLVTISKTWQEEQFEPFKLTLSMEGKTTTPVVEMEKIAAILQRTANRIYEKRCR